MTIFAMLYVQLSWSMSISPLLIATFQNDKQMCFSRVSADLVVNYFLEHLLYYNFRLTSSYSVVGSEPSQTC